MLRYIFILFFILISFCLTLHTSRSIGMSGSNVALTKSQFALIDNPAYIAQSSFKFHKETLDLNQTYYRSYEQWFMNMGKLAYGEINQHYKDENFYKINLIGYGEVIDRKAQWGVVYQNIQHKQDGKLYNTWAMNLGVAALISARPLTLIGLKFGNFYKDPSVPEQIDLPLNITVGLAHELSSWAIWKNSIVYQRKKANNIEYSSGMKLDFEKFLVLLGLGSSRYSLGIEISTLIGELSYSVSVPYQLEEQVQYSIAYTYLR